MTDLETNTEEIRQFFLALGNQDKQIFLAILSNSLTVDGRGFLLDDSGEPLIRALRGLNELQHQISQHIAALGLGRDRYPDEVLWNILYEKADRHEIRAALERSLKFVRSRDGWNQAS